jgi:hypothetical protein
VRTLLRLATTAFVALVTQPAPPRTFDASFTADTMRVDYFHTRGPQTAEAISLDRIVNDGPWPGSRTQLVDSTNLGTYLFEVKDKATRTLLYSRGFASVYGEWETTGEVKTSTRTFHESLRFPWPKQPVTVVLSKRQPEGSFSPIWTTEVDPSSRSINHRALASHAGTVWPVFINGPAAEKVDILVIGEGYTAGEIPKFHADVQRLLPALFNEDPFKSRKSDFNVRALDLPSPESGVNRPNAGEFRRTPLSAEYNIFDSERYVLTLDNRALRDAASAAPYEFIEILVNDKTYGGGGIFNDQATASVDSAFSPYVFVHEFGHHFAALADEYYTSDVAFEAATDRIEPWEPNVTALRDPSSLKWRDLVKPGTPLPTPWSKEPFETASREYQAKRRKIRAERRPEQEMDALFSEEKKIESKLLSSDAQSTKVGAFEGAMYEGKGYYRPEEDCVMFTRDEVPFCAVCQRALSRIIDLYTAGK